MPSTEGVKFVDDGTNFAKPVEPQLLSLLARQRLDALLSHPVPAVVDALSMHSVSLYDVGVQAGMDWHRRSNADVTNPLNNESHREYEMMSDRLRNVRAHTSDCKHLAYIEGWLAGWHAQPEIEGRNNNTPHAHTVNRGAF